VRSVWPLAALAACVARHPALVAPPGAPPPRAPPAPLAKHAEAAEIRSELLHAWDGYRRYAWGHDELKPLSRAPSDWNAKPLLLTPVDALDTLIVVQAEGEAETARALIDDELSFDQDAYVKVFEITIRELGGLLSGYQMTGDARLLALARDLGRRLAPAFKSKTGMPYQYVNLRTGAVRGATSNPAEVGTLLLEFGTLARLSGEPAHFDRARRALVALYQRRSELGLYGSAIDVETGKWLDETAHIGSGIDSYYEYLVKAGRLFGDEELARMGHDAIAAANSYLSQEDALGALWYGRVDRTSGKRKASVFGALDAFFPAVLVLDGDTGRAARLETSAYGMWRAFGLEPELYDYLAAKLVEPEYHLRPEIIESAYYLWRATHDQRWREMGKTFFAGLEEYCRTSDAYAAIADVRTKKQVDRMESYFFAETMKYLYLLFAPDDALPQGVIFNTEAHPLQRTW
jgi:mannosidase alpha-like ER degradation enhancer 2